jgi:hypothetical protein
MALDAGASVELSEGFDNGLGQWELLNQGGFSTAGAGFVNVTAGPGADAFLLHRLTRGGNLRVTVSLTVLQVNGTGADDDHFVGVALRSDPLDQSRPAAGAECDVIQDPQTNGRQLALTDLNTFDSVSAQTFDWTLNTKYTMIVTLGTDGGYTCSVGATTSRGTPSAAAETPPYVTLHATGMTAQLDSVLVERTP